MAAGPVYYDVTFLAFGRDLRGIPQVILQLARLFLSDPAFAAVRFVSTPAVTAEFLDPLGVPRARVDHVRPAPLLGRYERFHGAFSTWRYRALAARASLFIHPELRTVMRTRVPQAVVYYDFIALEPSGGGESRKWLRWLYLRYKNARAAEVRFKVAISEYTRTRALALFPGMRPDSVAARLLGARMRTAAGPREAPAPGNPLRFLYVGSYDARKNIPALLAHLGAVAGSRPAVLSLAGRMGPEREAFLRGLAGCVPAGVRVDILGQVGEDELAGLYREADFLLFPSLFEGFGLPVVEAMAQGTVVCAFRNSSLPEVCGDAALLAEVGDFAAWGRAIAALAADPAAYREASRRSLERAGEFTEERMHARWRDYFLGVLAASGAAAHDAGGRT